MYKITKFICDTETINLVFDDAYKAKEVFSDLRHDEFVRFRRLYENGITKETREETVNGELVYSEYKLSVPSFNVIITLEYV